MRIVLPLSVVVACTFGTTLAAAQDQEAPEPLSGPSGVPEAPEPKEGPSAKAPASAKAEPAEEDEDEAEEDQGALVPPASDTLAGHVSVSPTAALALPFGSLSSGVEQSQVAGSGYALSLDAGIGVSRTVVVGAWGQLQRFGAPDDCASCSLSSLGFGAFVRYHLVQGVRFDPWMSAGIGYRMANLDGGPFEGSYSGVEWLRLQLGGDWYPFDLLGVGPLLELDMGAYSSRPDDNRDSALHWAFLLGARITLDIPGK